MVTTWAGGTQNIRATMCGVEQKEETEVDKNPMSELKKQNKQTALGTW